MHRRPARGHAIRHRVLVNVARQRRVERQQLVEILRYADAGGAVLFYSTEVPELVHLADRVLVFYAGKIAADIPSDRLSEEAILRAALGTADSSEAAA